MSRMDFSDFSVLEIRAGLESVRTAMMLGEITDEQFDMNFAAPRPPHLNCGCIGYWLAEALRIPRDRIEHAVCSVNILSYHTALYPLFFNWYDEDFDGEVENPKTTAAVKAITAWLAGEHRDPWRAHLEVPAHA
jgi:hypothetical protein